MKITEQEYNEFFNGIKFRDTPIPSTGEICPMPLVGEKATQMAAFFTASRSKVMEILPVPEIHPVKLPDDKTVMGVVAIEYFKRNIPNYSEVVVVFPAFIGKDKKAPTMEDLLKENLGGTVLYIRHIAVTTRLAEVVGNELLGYAKFIGDITFEDSSEGRTCSLSDDGQEILKLSVSPTANDLEYTRETLSVATYKNDQFYKLTYKSQTKDGQNSPPKGKLTFGPHPLGKILSTLDVSEQPVYVRYSPHFNLISDDKQLEVFKP